MYISSPPDHATSADAQPKGSPGWGWRELVRARWEAHTRLAMPPCSHLEIVAGGG